MRNTRIHQALAAEGGHLVFPGCYDCLSARLVQQAGFGMSFISGYSVAATALGEPDMGLLTQTEIADQARRICNSVSIPILVDADTGYGNPLNVIRTVKLLIAGGAAGCFLEDQVWPKRCGHMRNKRVIDRSEYIDKVRAAVEARGDADFFIVARTDSLAAISLDEALIRVRLAREAGADASFIEAPESVEQMRIIGRDSPHPNVANMIEHGRTPVLPKDELAAMGFHLILYPLAGLFAAARAMDAVYRQLRTQSHTRGIQMMDFPAFNSLIGVDEKYRTAERFGAG